MGSPRSFRCRCSARASATALSFLLGLGLSSLARADAGLDPDYVTNTSQPLEGDLSAQRDRLIAEGDALADQGAHAQALARFEAALQVRADGGVIGRLALVEFELERWVAAAEHLEEACKATTDPWVIAHRRELDVARGKVELVVGKLAIEVTVPGAEVFLDTRLLGQAPLSRTLVHAPGRALIVVKAEGYRPERRTSEVRVGQPQQVLIAALTKIPSDRRTPLLWVAGSGAAIALVSIGPWLASAHVATWVKRDCEDETGCSQQNYDSLHERVRRLDLAANTMLYGGLGVAALAGAAYWLWPRARQSEIQPSLGLQSNAVRLQVAGKFTGL